MRRKKRSTGRILRIKPGINPNSSSIGTDLSAFLIGAATVAVLVNVADAAIRLWWRKKTKAGNATG